MIPTPLERALWVAARGPLGAAFVRDGVAHVAIEPAETLTERDPSRALERFADAVDAWSDAGAGPSPRAFGWLSYDALRADEPGADTDTRPRADDCPAAWLARYDAVLSVDLARGTASLRADDGTVAARLEAAWRESADAIAQALEPVATESATDETAHGDAVRIVQESIRAGDVYLVNVARVVHAAAGLSRAQVAARVAASRAVHAALIDAGETFVGGMSMELALAWDRASSALCSRPIKGTRPRGASPAEDERLAAALASDPKERAENVMAVDVHRNDLARVSRVGTVRVPALCVAEPHAFVHHLVSTVESIALPGVKTRDVLASILPAGSVTGAPKRTAMTAIAAVERERRGLYTGVYGTVGGDGSLALAVAIRTIAVDARGAHYGSGGGIVLDSVPAREWEELAWKERALSGAPRRR